METMTALKTIDQAIADRLAYKAEQEHKRLEAEAEQDRLHEAGKEPFCEALARRIASDYGIDIHQSKIEVEYSGIQTQDEPNYNFRLFVEADDVEGIKIKAWISQKWARSAQKIEGSNNPRDTVWIARRHGLLDGPDEQPVTLYAEFSDFVDALVWAKSHK